MIAELVYKLLKPLVEKRAVPPISLQAGDVMTAAKTNDTVTVTEVAEHWVRCHRADGTGFMRSRRSFMKHYRHLK